MSPYARERASEEKLPVRRLRGRLLFAGIFLTITFVALGWRLQHIQISDHDQYVARASAIRRATEKTLAYRGDIVSSDGVILARDLVRFDVGLDPRFIEPRNLDKVVAKICTQLGATPEYRGTRLRVARELMRLKKRYVHIMSEVDAPAVERVRAGLKKLLTKKELRAFRAEPRTSRVHPRGGLLGPVVGVTNHDGTGIEGIERAFDKYLSPRHGQRELIVDASRKMRILNPGNLSVPAVSGYDVHLTIDSRLQAVVERELERGVLREKAEAGVVVVMDCNTGDVLALASYPAYEPDHYRDYPKEERKLRRKVRGIENLYEPGSVMKPFVLAWNLENKLCRRNQRIREFMLPGVKWNGGTVAFFGSRPVRDVHEHPGMTVEEALVHSSNISFGLLGLNLGRDRMIDMLAAFGLCRPTGIELPAEASGRHTKKADWRAFYTGVSTSFGYEILVSPLQLCRAFAAVVNGGNLLRPRIVQAMRRGNEQIDVPSRRIDGKPISPDTSKAMREILHRVVEEGTGRWLRLEGFSFGGKTGTAKIASNGYTENDYLASFEAFAPFEEPQVALICMVDKPRARSHYGSWVAGPIVVEILRYMFDVEAQCYAIKNRR